MSSFLNSKSSLKLEFLIYSISIGINRGAIIILTPFLIANLNIADFGNYNYVQILLQLFGPIICLNLYAAISRDGGDDYRYGNYIINKFFLPVLSVTAIVSIPMFFFHVNTYIVFGVILGGIEGVHNMILSALRCMNKHFKYLLFTCLKTVGLVVIFYIVKSFSNQVVRVDTFLQIQVFWMLIIALFFQYFFIKKEEALFYPLKAAVLFSIVLIPHSLSQWIISGTGRFVIKNFMGAEKLGIYSTAFNLSMILMVLNSGIGLILPQHLIRDYDKWTETHKKFSFFLLYSITAVVLYITILFVVTIDELYFHFFNFHINSIIILFFLNYLAFYFLGYYYYYSNILFVHRKTKLITVITVSISIITILLNILLINGFGILGAAISSVLVYILYVLLCAYFSFKADRSLNFTKELLLSIGTSLTLLLISMIYIYNF